MWNWVIKGFLQVKKKESYYELFDEKLHRKLFLWYRSIKSKELRVINDGKMHTYSYKKVD